MGAQFVSGYITLKAAAAVDQNRRVVIDSSGTAAIATGSQRGIGVTQNMASAAGAVLNIRLWTHSGSFNIAATGVIAQYAVVYAAADGEINDVAGPIKIGIALEAATADQDEIEIFPDFDPVAPATHTIVAAGTHTWGGGAAATDAIVPGVALSATDVIHATVAAKGANAITGVSLCTIDDVNDEIDITVDANGEDAVTKIYYSVLRAIA